MNTFNIIFISNPEIQDLNFNMQSQEKHLPLKNLTSFDSRTPITVEPIVRKFESKRETVRGRVRGEEEAESLSLYGLIKDQRIWRERKREREREIKKKREGERASE